MKPNVLVHRDAVVWTCFERERFEYIVMPR